MEDALCGMMKVYTDRNGADFIVFGELDKPYCTKTALNALSKAELQDLYSVHYACPDGMTKKEMIEDLVLITMEEYFEEVYDNTSWHDLPYDYILCGYSQGGAVKVYVHGNMAKDQSSMIPAKDDLHHLLFDSPISGHITVKGEEIDEGLILDSCYKYDKQAALAKARNIDQEDLPEGVSKEDLLSVLEAFLPDKIAYR